MWMLNLFSGNVLPATPISVPLQQNPPDTYDEQYKA